jgi:hypothetical protein
MILESGIRNLQSDSFTSSESERGVGTWTRSASTALTDEYGCFSNASMAAIVSLADHNPENGPYCLSSSRIGALRPVLSPVLADSVYPVAMTALQDPTQDSIGSQAVLGVRTAPGAMSLLNDTIPNPHGIGAPFALNSRGEGVNLSIEKFIDRILPSWWAFRAGVGLDPGRGQ